MAKAAVKAAGQKKRENALLYDLKHNKFLLLMLVPGILFFVVFAYIPLIGIVIAFQDFSAAKGILGSPFVGFENFRFFLGSRDSFVWDYEEAEHEHIYECCYHPFGSVKMEGVSETGFTEYMDADPFGAGQFIRSCHWYDFQGTVKLGFHNTQSRVNPNDIIDFAERVNLYGVYPQSGTVMLGRYPDRKDTFAAGENCGIQELAADPCKKTAAFHQKGRCARFVTALEVGDENIREIVCSSYERIIFERHDGSRWEICVRGMDDRRREDLSVEYHRIGSEV